MIDRRSRPLPARRYAIAQRADAVDRSSITSPLAIWETVIAVARVLGLDVADASVAVERLLSLTSIEVQAVLAESRFGKGRHPAALNFGHCLAYACARQFLPLRHDSTIATARVHPAEARAIFTGKHAIMKPCGGRLSRLCSFSIWQ